jgi:amino acid transporter
MFATSRIIAAVARAHLLPPFLARVHPRLGTPYAATLLSGTAAAIMALFTGVLWMLECVCVCVCCALCAACFMALHAALSLCGATAVSCASAVGWCCGGCFCCRNQLVCLLGTPTAWYACTHPTARRSNANSTPPDAPVLGPTCADFADLVDMVSISTLFAFLVVALALLWHRHHKPGVSPARHSLRAAAHLALLVATSIGAAGC